MLEDLMIALFVAALFLPFVFTWICRRGRRRQLDQASRDHGLNYDRLYVASGAGFGLAIAQRKFVWVTSSKAEVVPVVDITGATWVRANGVRFEVKLNRPDLPSIIYVRAFGGDDLELMARALNVLVESKEEATDARELSEASPITELTAAIRELTALFRERLPKRPSDRDPG